MPQTAYFISDAHLGIHFPGLEQRQAVLIDFLRGLVGKAGYLFILGDLFDFWIEYKKLVRSDFFPILHELRNLAEKNVEIHLLAGNHDFAFERFMPDVLGIQVHLDYLNIELQNKKIHLRHGDGFRKGDPGYRLLRAMLRNKTNQWLYKMIHPALGIDIALAFSHCSRLSRPSAEIPQRTLEKYYEAAKKYLDSGADIVVLGHTHRPELFKGNNKTYCNTGEWFRKYSYAKLEDGEMTLWKHLPKEADQEISASALPLK